MSDDPFDDVELPDRATEEGTDRDGVLSYSGEWHALFIGIGVGLTGAADIAAAFAMFVLGVGGEKFRNNGHIRDATKEGAYSFAGVVIGLVLHLFAFGAASLGGLWIL
jgi:hypothetical protein